MLTGDGNESGGDEMRHCDDDVKYLLEIDQRRVFDYLVMDLKEGKPEVIHLQQCEEDDGQSLCALHFAGGDY